MHGIDYARWQTSVASERNYLVVKGCQNEFHLIQSLIETGASHLKFEFPQFSNFEY